MTLAIFDNCFLSVKKSKNYLQDCIHRASVRYLQKILYPGVMMEKNLQLYKIINTVIFKPLQWQQNHPVVGHV